MSTLRTALVTVAFIAGCDPNYGRSPPATPPPTASSTAATPPASASAARPPPAPTVATPVAAATPGCTKGRAWVIFRHGEKTSEKEKDPPLSEKGKARARTIATMLGNIGVTKIYATQFKRTQDTVAPLSEKVSVPVEARAAERTKDVVAELRNAPDGSVIVVATHSNFVTLFTRELGNGAKLRGVSGEFLAEDDHSRVVVITQACGGSPYVVELSSGD